MPRGPHTSGRSARPVPPGGTWNASGRVWPAASPSGSCTVWSRLPTGSSRPCSVQPATAPRVDMMLRCSRSSTRLPGGSGLVARLEVGGDGEVVSGVSAAGATP